MAYAANKVVTIAGKTYARGEEVDVSTLLDHKIAQFLRQRIIVPMPPTQPDNS